MIMFEKEPANPENNNDTEFSDPYQYYQSFLNSDVFKSVIEERRREIKVNSGNVSEEKLKEGFLMTDKYKQSLWDYYEGGQKNTYNPNQYSNEVKEATERYWQFIINSR